MIKICIFCVLVISCYATSDPEAPNDDDIIDTEAVVGTVAILPCDISPRDPQSGDKLELVLWYKEGKLPPIYSYDIREKGPGVHGNDPFLHGRSAFRPQPPAALQLRRIVASDTGLYRCRADFSRSRTKNTYVRLDVIIPPDQMTILDENGEKVHQSIIGPYFESTTVMLTCVVTGGKPKPTVSWWYNDVLIDDTSQSVSEKRVKNVLQLGPLRKNDSNALIKCVAINNNVTKPVVTSVILDMMLPPTSIELIKDDNHFIVGTKKTFVCEIGQEDMKHSLSIFWKKGNESITDHTESTTENRDTIWSSIELFGDRNDDGQNLTCCAGGHAFDRAMICDEWPLEVLYAPILTLQANSMLSSVATRLGEYVIFNCSVDAKPEFNNVTWYLNDQKMEKDDTMDDETVLTLKAQKDHMGLYYCTAANSVGISKSNNVWLEVKYSPICVSADGKFDMSVGESVKIECNIDAYPPMKKVIWKFNSSVGNQEDIIDVETAKIEIVNGTTSILHYELKSTDDYGTVYCIAVNDMGVQEEPCIFEILATTSPDSPNDCEVINHTGEIIIVECKAGHDGGLKQEFKMDVVNPATKHLVTSVWSEEPLFTANLVGNNSDYDIIISSHNVKGESSSVILSTNLEEFTQLHTAPSPAIMNMTPFMLALIGGVALVVLIACTIILAIRERWTSPSGSTANDGPSAAEREIPPYNVDISGRLLLGKEFCDNCNYGQDAECTCDKESSEWSARRSGSFKAIKSPKPDSISIGVDGTLMKRQLCKTHSQDADKNPFGTARRTNQPPGPKDDEALLCLRNTCATLGRRSDNIRALSDHLMMRLPAELDNYSVPRAPLPYPPSCNQPIGMENNKITVTADIETEIPEPNYTNVIISPLNTVGLPATSRNSTPYGQLDDHPLFRDQSSVGITPFRTTSLQHRNTNPPPEDRY